MARLGAGQERLKERGGCGPDGQQGGRGAGVLVLRLRDVLLFDVGVFDDAHDDHDELTAG